MPIAIGSQTIGGSGGLPAASGSGQTLISSGAGSTYTARALAASDVSGVGITTGTYAARPASPSVGDRYLVSSGARRGSLYQCLVAGSWSRAALDLGLGDTPSLIFDAEDLPPQDTGLLRAWRPVGAGQSFELVTGSTPPTIIGSSLGGMPALSFSSAVLRLAGPNLMKDADKTIILEYSSLQTTGNNGMLAIGDPTNTSGSFGVFGNFQASLSTRAYLEYDGGSTGIYDSGTTVSAAAGIHSIAVSWEQAAAKARFYADGSPTATASQVPGSTRGVLATASQITLGAGRCNATATGVFRLHSVILVPRRLSDAELSALHTLMAARFS